MAEAVSVHVVARSALWQRVRQRRVQRVTCRRDEHGARRREVAVPRQAGFSVEKQRTVLCRAAGEGGDGPGQLRERRDVVGLLVCLPREDRREPEARDVLLAVGVDARLPHDAVDPGESSLVFGTAAI
ncbi:Uncharacterised protein [Mycobacteroides abscessus subsp. abscessus]|nr:Uncharacterised protein [Mycobacteroides abscessus subsp. abscessus]